MSSQTWAVNVDSLTILGRGIYDRLFRAVVTELAPRALGFVLTVLTITWGRA